MDQAPDASERIVDDRAIRRFEPAILADKTRVAHGWSEGSRTALRHTEVPFERTALSFDQSGRRYGSKPACVVLNFSSGLHGVALPQALQPHSRSARARFAPPPAGAGRVPSLNEIHQGGLATTMPYGPTRSEDHPLRAGRAALVISGALFSLAGFVLALGGYRPAARDGAAGTPDPLPHPTSERLIERTSAMMYDWQTSLRASDYYAARILPPATVEETGWDILLALHSDRHCCLTFQKLASMVSVPDGTIDRWLGALEERKLITGARHPSTDELLAVLTEMGRGLLDRYFSATKDLQVGAHS
jgi:DNA-binding MarR family transcriptional regulator